MNSPENNTKQASGNRWQSFKRVTNGYSLEERVLSIIAGALLIFFGIQGGIDLFNGSESNEATTYTEGLINPQPTLINPLYVDFSEANRDISSLIFSGLTRYNPPTKTFTDDLASLNIDDNKTTYRFTLHDNLVWHDGTAVTADDIYFTYHDIIQSPDFQNPIIKGNFEGVTIKQIDEKTIEFKLEKPNSFFITNCNVGILPKHLLGDTPVKQLPISTFNLHPIGTGPYKIQSPLEILDDGRQRVTLTAFSGYTNSLPKITTIKFRMYPDTDSLLKEQSTLNIINKLPLELLPELQKDPRFNFTTYELPQYTAVFINNDSEILKKQKVRLALEKAIDKQKLLEILPHKQAVDTPLMELNQTEWLYKPNIEESKGALFDSGYKMPKSVITDNLPDEDSDEMMYRKGPDNKTLILKMVVRSYDEGSTQAEEMKILTDFLVNSWKEAGIKINVIELPLESFNQAIQNRDYDLIIAGESLGYNLDTYPYWHSSQANANGLNLSNYRSSFTSDTAIENIRTNSENKEKDLQALAKSIAEDIPAIFLYRPSYIFASDGKVKNSLLQNLAYPSDRFATIEQWCINC